MRTVTVNASVSYKILIEKNKEFFYKRLAKIARVCYNNYVCCSMQDTNFD